MIETNASENSRVKQSCLEKLERHFSALKKATGEVQLSDEQIINCMRACYCVSLDDPDSEELKKSYELSLKYLSEFEKKLSTL